MKIFFRSIGTIMITIAIAAMFARLLEVGAQFPLQVSSGLLASGLWFYRT